MNIISQPSYGIKLVYSGINNAHADMCFSNIFITHTIFLKKHINVCIPSISTQIIIHLHNVCECITTRIIISILKYKYT